MNRINNDNDLMLIVGGFNFTGTIGNVFLNAGKFVYSLGQSLGSAIRRLGTGNVCKI